jgi:hypothetical protein
LTLTKIKIIKSLFGGTKMRRSKFSEKYGYSGIRESLQLDNIDNRLNNRIWNTIEKDFLDLLRKDSVTHNFGYCAGLNRKDLKVFSNMYDEYFALKNIPSRKYHEFLEELHDRYIIMAWFEIYDFIEALVYYHYEDDLISHFKKKINLVLEHEMSAYRFIDDCIAPIIEEVEIKEIEDVFKLKYDSVKGHIAKALEHLSDRENPDYQNSIKESISAVESIVNIVIGRGNVALNKGLLSLPFEIDNNFKQGMIRLYSWTSSSDGIRHGAHESEILSGFDEAKYMLVSCCAFINYLISKNESNKAH